MGWGVVFCQKIFVACEIFSKFTGPLFFPLTFRLLQTLRFLCPPLISLSFCSNHLIGPLIGHDLSFAPPPPHTPFFSGFSMVKTRGGSAFRPRVRRSSLPPAGGSSVAPPAVAEPVAAPPAAVVAPPAAAQGSVAVGSSAAAPTPRRYHTRVGPTPPSPPHPRPSRRSPQSKRARTSGPRESSSSRPQEPQSPPYQGPTGAPPLDLSLASIIRRPLFHCTLSLGMLIAVTGTCMTRFITIFHLFPQTRSFETRCS